MGGDGGDESEVEMKMVEDKWCGVEVVAAAAWTGGDNVACRDLEVALKYPGEYRDDKKDCALSLDKLAMSPHFYKKFRMGVAIAKGCRGYYEPGTRAWVRRGSRKIRIPIAMYPCRVEKVVTTVTKNGVVTRYPGKFHEYQLTDKEKEFQRMMIYWEQVEYEMSDDDDSDLESTARSVPKDYELGDTGSSSGI
ncbi:hypothetical protein Tco_0280326 [Tanacetum coccineum]